MIAGASFVKNFVLTLLSNKFSIPSLLLVFPLVDDNLSSIPSKYGVSETPLATCESAASSWTPGFFTTWDVSSGALVGASVGASVGVTVGASVDASVGATVVATLSFVTLKSIVALSDSYPFFSAVTEIL